MDWVLQVLIFGFTALFFFIASVAYIRRKQYGLGLCFAILELFSVAVSSDAWAWALRVSGKRDWFLLGLLRYTSIALVFWSMFFVGILCILINIRSLVKK